MDIPITIKPVTDLRVYLAEERTFLAWIRTGIALMGFGIVLAHFGIFPDENGDEFAQLHQGLVEEWKPSGALEEDTVLDIAQCIWLKRRVERFYRREAMGGQFQDADESQSLSLRHAQTLPASVMCRAECALRPEESLPCICSAQEQTRPFQRDRFSLTPHHRRNQSQTPNQGSC